MAKEKISERDFSLYSILSGLFYLIIATLFLLSLISYSSKDPSFSYATSASPENFLGKPGAYSIDFLLQAIGLSVVLFVAVPLIWGAKNIFVKTIK